VALADSVKRVGRKSAAHSAINRVSTIPAMASWRMAVTDGLKRGDVEGGGMRFRFSALRFLRDAASSIQPLWRAYHISV